MVDIIEGIIYPLSITVFFFGPGIFRYPLHNSRLYLNLFSALFLWSAYVYGFYYVVISWPEILGDFINSFAVIMSLIVTIMSIIITFHKKKVQFHFNEFSYVYKKLILVDDTLEKLGTPKEYHKIRNSIKQMLIIWFMMICVTLTSDSLLCIEVFKDIKAMLIPLFMDYCLWINTFMDIIFMVLLRYIGTRFNIINEHIRRLSETEKCGLRCTKKSVITRHYVGSTKNCKRTVWITMHLHSELCQVARDVNSLFGIQMTLQMISYFVLIIAMCHMQFNVLCFIQVYMHKVVTLKLLLNTNVWLTVYLTRLILLNHTCESVSTKVISIFTGFLFLQIITLNADYHITQILQFVLQISLRPLQFSGMGMFHFGYTFTRKFFLWVVTTIIFLMQMKSSPISRTLIFEGNNMTCD
ncbi:hypothetical protein X777_14755 [Ooceraea biroi]|uniref:Gustatory receptor n=1 Tax=Ooceraea biroi TaxID=2015173 RepID=A0A026WRC8_OOCBI|nr:hypothetical protein X777_14755 [Ooceraea biroi]